jgi:hypothetical protein
MQSIERSMEKYKSPTKKYYNQTHHVFKNKLEISYINTQVNTIQWNNYQKI